MNTVASGLMIMIKSNKVILKEYQLQRFKYQIKVIMKYDIYMCTTSS